MPRVVVKTRKPVEPQMLPIPPTLNLKLIGAAILALALLAAGFGAAWTIQGWRSDAAISKLQAEHAGELKTISDAATAAAVQYKKDQTAWQESLAALEKRHFKEMKIANSVADSLRRQLDDGSMRVFIDADCPADSGGAGQKAAAPGVDARKTRAQLDPKVAGNLAGIAADGDKAIRQLNALADYVEDVCLK